MSRSSKSNLAVRDNRVELLLGFTQSGNVVKNDFRFLVLLRTFGDTNLDRVNDRKGGISVINDFHGIVYAGYDDFRHLRSVIAVHSFRTAAPNEQTPFDGYIVERDFTVCRTAADDEIAVYGQVFQLYIVGADQDAAFNVLVISTLGHNVSANDICKNLCKFCAGDVVQRCKDFAATMNIVCTDHRAHIRHRPVGNLASVGERGQIRFGIRIVVQFQRTGNDRHSLLARDRRIRSHRRSRPTVVSTHLDGKRHVLVIPLALGYVTVLRNIRCLVAPERPVDDRSHLRTGHIAVGINDGCTLAIKQAVIHGCGHGFGVPCGTVIVLEICCFAGSRSCRRRADCQR